MKKTTIIAGISSLVLSALAVGAATGIFTPDNFTSYERRWQPAPTGYQSGKDNGAGIGTHHPGEDCGICHKPGGKAPDLIIAGTLYKDRLATQVAEGGEIILEDVNGKVISMVSNGAGNFWSSTPIGSYPYTVGTYHGHAPFVPKYELYSSGTQKGQLKTPADPNDSLTWKYKAWVKSGEALTPMLSVAGVGGGTTAPPDELQHAPRRIGEPWRALDRAHPDTPELPPDRSQLQKTYLPDPSEQVFPVPHSWGNPYRLGNQGGI